MSTLKKSIVFIIFSFSISFFLSHTLRQSFFLTNSDSPPRSSTSKPEQKIEDNESQRSPDSITPEQAAEIFKDFIEERNCLGVNIDSQKNIRNDIASLKSSLKNPKISLEFRKTLETAIDEKQKFLDSRMACLTGNQTITSDRLHALLLSAAQAGDENARIQYARDPVIDPLQDIRHIDELRQWSRLARRYVDTTIQAGDPDAILLQAEASDPFRCQASNDANCAGLYTNLVNESAYAAYMNYYLLETLDSENTPAWVKDELSGLEGLLSQKDIIKAKNDALIQAEKLSPPVRKNNPIDAKASPKKREPAM